MRGRGFRLPCARVYGRLRARPVASFACDLPLTTLKGSSPVADSRDRAGSAALASARFLVSERVSDLEEAVSDLERRIAESEAQRAELRERLERAEVIRRH